MIQLRDVITNQLPFISVLQYGDHEYVGIIINQDSNVTSFYDLTLIKTDNERKQFLQLGEIWWWESNHRIPINIFLNQDMDSFQYAIKTFNSKDVRISLGPVINLSNLVSKRPKKKSVQLVKKILR
jgi:hypothetical protein